MSFLIINKYRVIIAAIIVFSVRINILVYAQTPAPEDAGSDLMEKLLTATESVKGPQKKEAVPPDDEPVMKIERLDNESQVYSFELKDAQIKDIFRVLAYDYKLNLLVDNEVEGKMTATMTNVSLEQFLEAAAELLNLTIEKSGSFVKVRPNLITKIFVLKYVEALTIAMVVDQTEIVKKESTIYDLLSPKGKVFIGRQPNSIMVIDYPPNMRKVEDYLKEIDRRMSSQVFKLKYLKASDIAEEGASPQAPGASGNPFAISGGAQTSGASDSSSAVSQPQSGSGSSSYQTQGSVMAGG
ncbi:MAG: hypothetical protein Q7J72_07105 [Candidatus Omnitrophota bacterium]|nr:hypothetical protein [Candidatus Omnitrophota bacterium]